MSLTVVRILQLVVLLVFAVLVSDFRKKPNTVKPLARGWYMAKTFFYPLIIVLYGVAVFRADLTINLITLALTVVGTAVTGWAKHTLGPVHRESWCIAYGTEYVRTGPYRWCRHPMYAAIWLVQLSGALLYTFALPTLWQVIGYIGEVFVAAWLITSARAEDAHWKQVAESGTASGREDTTT